MTRAAISRSVRSVSARRAVSSRERPSSLISSALWIAIVARSASAARVAAWSGPKRPGSPANTASVPSTVASPMSGANAIEQTPGSREEVGVLGPVAEPLVGGVVVGRDDPPLADREEHAVAADAATLPLGPGRVLDARVVRPVDLAGRRVEEVDDGAARAEQPGRLVDDVLEQLRRVLDDHHPAGDLAQRALRLRGPAEGRLRRREPVDEAGVGDARSSPARRARR